MPIWLGLTIAAFASLGVGLVTMVVCLLLEEVFRALRQSHRIAVVCIRTRLFQRRNPTLREWWRCFCREVFSEYTSLEISFIEIPHDPSKPMRSALRRYLP